MTPVTGMATYFIVNAHITDPEGLERYLASVGPSLEGRDLKYLVATNDATPIEGTRRANGQWSSSSPIGKPRSTGTTPTSIRRSSGYGWRRPKVSRSLPTVSDR